MPEKRVQEDRFHAEAVGNTAAGLATGAAKTGERVFGDVISALHGNLLDGVCHVLHGDFQEAVGNLFCRPTVADRLSQFGKLLPDNVTIQLLILFGTEDFRKEFRCQLAGHEVGVRDRERTATPVTGRTGIGTG